jgi:predicted metalloprotease with PDZ domain
MLAAAALFWLLPLPAVTIDLDLADAPKHVYHARLVIPAQPGPLSLLYPKWIPGMHAPDGPIGDLTGLIIRACGQKVPWRRDPLEPYRLRCEVPKGAEAIEVSLDYLVPSMDAGGASGKFVGSPSASARAAAVQWHEVTLYVEGPQALARAYKASVTLPGGWKLSTALPFASRSGAKTSFQEVPLQTLIDSPVIAGAYMREVALGRFGGADHFMDAVADSEWALDPMPSYRDRFQNVIREAFALFGARHYRSYHFLITLSDRIAGTLEHAESSDNRLKERALVDEELFRAQADLLPHEYIHSWNGKYRRPSGLVGDYLGPLDSSLLWVYEGLTNYLGTVLAVRGGLWTEEYARSYLAFIANQMTVRRGRAWRPLEDTATEAAVLYYGRPAGEAWRRGTDFYREGILIWLDIDARIRRRSGGQKSLDDFCKTFFGEASGPPNVRPYGFEDVVSALSGVAADGWKALLTDYLTSTRPEPPLGGLASSGWKLAWSEEKGAFQKDVEKSEEQADLTASLGLLIAKKGGAIIDVIPGSPADRAGIAPGSILMAVNGREWDEDVLTEAVRRTGKGGPLTLLVKCDGLFSAHAVDYRKGLRYPRLERVSGASDLLSNILRARARTAANR